jgi:hypothetical protein
MVNKIQRMLYVSRVMFINNRCISQDIKRNLYLKIENLLKQTYSNAGKQPFAPTGQ